MLLTERPQTDNTRRIWAELRLQAHYWRTQHKRAREREAEWKKKALELKETTYHQEIQITELTSQLEKLKAQAVWLRKQVFGRKTQQAQNDDHSPICNDKEELTYLEEKRGRGKQKGAKGFGRKRYTNLPAKEIFHDLPEEEKRCPKCGKAFTLLPLTEDSEEIHIETSLIRRIHKRRCYSAGCACKAVPGIVSAPHPPKLIPKGMFSIDFWVYILLEKFLFQRPLYRILQALKMEGLFIPQGTITGGLKKIGELVQPLYTRILEKNRSARHWHIDESHWHVFLLARDNDINKGWWLWVIVTKDTCVYIIAPSRSSEVLKHHLGEDIKGIINADRFSAYKKLGKKVRIAFCWSHVRTDFIKIHDGYKELKLWAKERITRINEIFDLNKKRLLALSRPEGFEIADQCLRAALNSMKEVYEKELLDNSLHPEQRRVLKSLRNHWKGLLIFVDHPEIPMDNNLSERMLRNPVLGRKNYYGSGSIWSSALTANLYTISQTLLLNNINPKKFLKSYFEACAQNHGKILKDINDFLPWNMSRIQKQDWRYEERGP